MLLRNMSKCDCRKTSQTRFRSKQIVVALIASRIVDIITDRKQITICIIKETKIHLIYKLCV